MERKSRVRLVHLFALALGGCVMLQTGGCVADFALFMLTDGVDRIVQETIFFVLDSAIVDFIR